LLNHQIKSLHNHYIFERDGSKKEIYEVRKSRYNRKTNALERLKEYIYSDKNFSRKFEYEADSLGYVLFNNTTYNKADYLRMYKLMELYDSIKPNNLRLDTYRTLFTLPQQSFKEEWLKKEDFSAYDYSKYKAEFNEDSLSSHPELKKRIARLSVVFPVLTDTSLTSLPGKRYKEISHIAYMEHAPNLDYNEAYGFGVYYCMLRLQSDSTDQYHKDWLGKFMMKIYDARKSYTLNRYLDHIESKDQSESYQQFLNFMWNLKLNEIKVIADNYSKKGTK
jgi:hypothetical protein